MNHTSRVLLALFAFHSVGCQKVPVDVGDLNRDGGVGAAPAVGGAGGATTPGTGGTGGASSSSGVTILETPERAIDILFVVDNSPSMDPKQQALAQNFPKMMEALQAASLYGMPDVHIGVISSDMGAGTGEAGQNCASVLGNQGLLWGNDPEQLGADPNNGNYNKWANIKEYKTKAGDSGCGMNPGARWIEDIQIPGTENRSKNYKGELTDVFSCLAQGVGVSGCGFEHPLQSLRVALNPIEQYNAQNKGFLRRNAHLAIVILSDEDDCSADPNRETNDGMFFPRILSETASLRCAARGHVCNGASIPNYDPAIGFSGPAFSANFAECQAKDGVSSSGARDYHSLPLIPVREMIASVMGVKERPEAQILMFGIIGWPENGDPGSVHYRIDKNTTALIPTQQNAWDYMPICTRLDVKSASDGEIYKAYGGLRLKKFIDGFGQNGQTYSICSPEGIGSAMQEIGKTIARKTKPGCFTQLLVDGNPNLPGTQPQCSVQERMVCYPGADPRCDPKTGYTTETLSQCLDPTTGIPALDSIPEDGRPCWYLAYDTNPDTGCPEAPFGQRISVLRRAGMAAPSGTYLDVSCNTCASASDPRCASH